jgi:hypothetical protein
MSFSSEKKEEKMAALPGETSRMLELKWGPIQLESRFLRTPAPRSSHSSRPRRRMPHGESLHEQIHLLHSEGDTALKLSLSLHNTHTPTYDFRHEWQGESTETAQSLFLFFLFAGPSSRPLCPRKLSPHQSMFLKTWHHLQTTISLNSLSQQGYDPWRTIAF